MLCINNYAFEFDYYYYCLVIHSFIYLFMHRPGPDVCLILRTQTIYYEYVCSSVHKSHSALSSLLLFHACIWFSVHKPHCTDVSVFPRTQTTYYVPVNDFPSTNHILLMCGILRKEASSDSVYTNHSLLTCLLFSLLKSHFTYICLNRHNP